MIMATKLRAGVNYLDEGNPYKVTEYRHTHMSRGGGTVKVRVKNLLTGAVGAKTYKSTEKFEEIEVNKKLMQYLYGDGENFVFMDPSSFEQLEVSREVADESGRFLKEGEEAQVLFWGERVLGVELPPKMVFEVAEAAPGERGDSASNVYKDAVLENGVKVRVPLFVNSGEKIRVDTRTGEYVERA